MALEISISAVNPKGGEWKTTAVQTIATSPPFKDLKKRILEVDAQGSISDWLFERKQNGLNPLDIEVVRFDEKTTIKKAIQKYKKGVDVLFLDLPGESRAAEKTRGALAYSDLILLPLRPSDKAIRAFENNLYQMISAISELRGIEPFLLLPTFAHPNSDRENYRKIFEPYTEVLEVMKNIHRDRQVFTYFSQGGNTLEEYMLSVKTSKSDYKTAKTAMDEVNLIAEELYDKIRELKKHG